MVGSKPDFLLEWYKLQREHELELNKATLAYELELAKLLVLLNGGAAGAFLTLIGTMWKEGQHPSLACVAAAIVSWLIGLLVAAFAIHRAYEIQRDYSTAYRYRRQLEELRRIKQLKVKADDLGIIPPAKPKPLWDWLKPLWDRLKIKLKRSAKRKKPQKPLAKKTLKKKIKDGANSKREEASGRSKRIWLWRYSAVMMFVLGSLFALIAFLPAHICPLWIISGHVQCTNPCPLCPQ